MNDDGRQQRKLRLNSLENPTGQNLAGGDGQAFDFVEVIVIELADDGIDDFDDIAVVDEVALGFINIAGNDNVELERMPMQSPAFVPFGERRKIVRGFKAEGFA